MYVLKCRTGVASHRIPPGGAASAALLPCSSRVADPPRPAREESAVSVRPVGCVMGAEPVMAVRPWRALPVWARLRPGVALGGGGFPVPPQSREFEKIHGIEFIEIKGIAHLL